eukprot:15475909-Alexandrium_andersonii.AAC.1
MCASPCPSNPSPDPPSFKPAPGDTWWTRRLRWEMKHMNSAMRSTLLSSGRCGNCGSWESNDPAHRARLPVVVVPRQ